MRKKSALILFILGVLFILTGISNFPQSYFLQNEKNKITLNKISISPSPEVFPSNTAIFNSTKSADIKKAFVTKVFDGDTIKLSDGTIVRYLGINSPEKNDPYFEEALNKNSSLVLDKTVYLEPDITAKDRYGRNLYYVFAGDIFVNLEIVKSGLAVSETIQPDVKYQAEIVAAQESARGLCMGIWKDLCSQGNASCIKINDINFDALGNDNTNKNGEWVELKNSCSRDISMDNWLIKDSSASNEYRFKNFTLGANQTVDLYSGCGTNTWNKLYWICPEQKYAVWNNAGDSAYLYDSGGNLVSDYQY